MPVVGLGSWITFNVGQDAAGLAASTEVIRAFLAGGGRMIDSSPMYGSAQATIGHALTQLGRPKAVWSADKVWDGDLARDRDIAVIVNRPFRQGALPQQLARHPLPGWAREVAAVFGRPGMQAEWLALAPDPTALATLTLLLLLDVGGHRFTRVWQRVLWVPPLLWCVAASLTLRTLGEAQAGLIAVLAVLAWLTAAGRSLRQG